MECPFLHSILSPPDAQKNSWKVYVDGRIPSDALPGHDGKFIGLVYYDGQVLPAQVCPEDRSGIAVLAEKQIIDENIKMLCTSNPKAFVWEPINFACATEDEMKDAIKGGFQDGYVVFIGKTCHEGEWKIGKVVPMNKPNKGLERTTVVRIFKGTLENANHSAEAVNRHGRDEDGDRSLAAAISDVRSPNKRSKRRKRIDERTVGTSNVADTLQGAPAFQRDGRLRGVVSSDGVVTGKCDCKTNLSTSSAISSTNK
ncbi:hypothetical protein Trydic_g15253 [Trypoxylus dichotomus]